MELALCHKRNPVLPASYFVLIAMTYWIYNKHVFSLLPTPITPAWHRYGPTDLLPCAQTVVWPPQGLWQPLVMQK